VDDETPIVAGAGRTMNLRVQLSSYKQPGPPTPALISVAVPAGLRNRPVVLRVAGGQNGELLYDSACLFDPDECDDAGSGAGSFTGLQQLLSTTPKNNQVRASLLMGGEDGFDPAARAKGVTETGRIVTGERLVPVVVR
jgi:hypothetical protein